MQPFSVIIIHYNRYEHLMNVLSGIEKATVVPDEVLIIHLGEYVSLPTPFSFPIVSAVIPFDDRDHLPIAKARNTGASLASNELMIFLDVDCIPASDCFETFCNNAVATDGLIMGTPRYLKQKVSYNFTFNQLYTYSILHPARPVIANMTASTTYELFWSLCFCITKKNFEFLGGFDEAFEGYGGEDTDFAFKARWNKLPFYLCDAIVFHQQHQLSIPPLDKFEAIIKNCQYFYDKWHIWPMDNYLHAFQKRNLINWKPKSTCEIKIVKKPTKSAIKNTIVLDAPFA